RAEARGDGGRARRRLRAACQRRFCPGPAGGQRSSAGPGDGSRPPGGREDRRHPRQPRMTAAPPALARAAPRLRVQLLVATFARVSSTTPHTAFSTLPPVFTPAVGVRLETPSRRFSRRGALGMTSPLFGALPDRFGRRTAMLIGLAVFCLG